MKYSKIKNDELINKVGELNQKHILTKNELISILDRYENKVKELDEIEKEYELVIKTLKERKG